MKKTIEIQKVVGQEPAIRNWLSYELSEDDFLVGKTPEFFPDVWEDEE